MSHLEQGEFFVIFPKLVMNNLKVATIYSVAQSVNLHYLEPLGK